METAKSILHLSFILCGTILQHFFKKLFHEHYQSVKRFGSRSRICVPESKLLSNVISRLQMPLLASKERVKNYLKIFCFRKNKKISVFQVTGLKILDRVGTHIFFLEKIYNFMHFERHFAFQNA